ncbi:hypothetical protein COS61_02255 [Candidatus Wolfebacteria bacterium CG03_land_8_20_14_0_80_40_12]|uniref:Uncharacterized protein n=1 Tax=Candidatus Wolfebacteria bacterium CG03_land_8_20_14_0_80_40_12 TaxID=1975069 RepID=A0A2M7B586_9BACT|nr:MAG: hypothetical protein COS61_02255 [Candidatus Wolfebacteria bacterium CG03_land_8_20_14_0_80_40_12]
MEGFKGRKFFAREPSESPPPARQRGAGQKMSLHFLILRAPIFSFRRKRQFFCEAGRRFPPAPTCASPKASARRGLRRAGIRLFRKTCPVGNLFSFGVGSSYRI